MAYITNPLLRFSFLLIPFAFVFVVVILYLSLAFNEVVDFGR